MKSLKRTHFSHIQSKPVKVIQFGAGNFVRGFVDWIFNIMNEKQIFEGHVQIIQSVSSSKDSHLNAQDGLYHVIEKGLVRGKIKEQLRLISCVRNTINAQEEGQRFLEIAKYEKLQFVVSNTTEAGIVFEEEPFEAGRIPKTFPGKLTLLLYERFQEKLGPLVILPCELIHDNGNTLRKQVLQYCRHWDLGPAFTDWIINENIFCNTLVDRIVPGAFDEITEEVRLKTGFLDLMPVMVEPYYFWAIEAPPAVREMLPADKCGLNVKYTDNLSYYRERKVRILNGAHTALMAVGYLHGLRHVNACFADEKIRDFIFKVVFKEIVPTLNGDRTELNAFADQVIERFTNPFIEHRLLSISLNSVAKFRVRILPTILRYREINELLPDGLMRSFAALIVFYRGHWRQQQIELRDEPDVVTFFRKVWNETEIARVATLVLENDKLWGSDLGQISGMEAALSSHLISILSEE